MNDEEEFKGKFQMEKDFSGKDRCDTKHVYQMCWGFKDEGFLMGGGGQT